jgi:hypothetical protein
VLAASGAAAAAASADGKGEHAGDAAPSSSSPAATPGDLHWAAGNAVPRVKPSQFRRQGDYIVVWQFRGDFEPGKGIAWYDYSEELQTELEQHSRTRAGPFYHREPGKNLMEYNLQRMCQHDTQTQSLTMMRRSMLHLEEWLMMPTTMRAYAEAEGFRAMQERLQLERSRPDTTAESKNKKRKGE